MLKKSRVFLSVSLLGACFIMFSAFTNCGGEHPHCVFPPKDGCYSNDDCKSGYRCERTDTKPIAAPVLPREDRGTTTDDDNGNGDSIGTKKQNVMAYPQPSPGRCVLETKPKPGCLSDRDCRGGQICVKPAVRCGGGTTSVDAGPAPSGAQKEAADAMPPRCGGSSSNLRGVCQSPPKPPKTACSNNNDCRRDEVCVMQKGEVPATKPDTNTPDDDEPTTGNKTAPAPAQDGGAGMPAPRPDPDTEYRRPPMGYCAPAPRRRCTSDSDCKSDEACAKTKSAGFVACDAAPGAERPNCMPPVPVGYCVPAPRRKCKADNDCNRGEFCKKTTTSTRVGCGVAPDGQQTNCALPAPPPEPTSGYCAPSKPPVTCTRKVAADGSVCQHCSDGTSLCSGSAPTPAPAPAPAP